MFYSKVKIKNQYAQKWSEKNVHLVATVAVILFVHFYCNVCTSMAKKKKIESACDSKKAYNQCSNIGS